MVKLISYGTRLEKSSLKIAKVQAKLEKRSVNSLIQIALDEYLDKTRVSRIADKNGIKINRSCINSVAPYFWPASFLAKNDEECCEFGHCEVMIDGKRIDENRFKLYQAK